MNLCNVNIILIEHFWRWFLVEYILVGTHLESVFREPRFVEPHSGVYIYIGGGMWYNLKNVQLKHTNVEGMKIKPQIVLP